MMKTIINAMGKPMLLTDSNQVAGVVVNMDLEHICEENCEWCADRSKRPATIRDPRDGTFHHFASGMITKRCDATSIRQEYEARHEEAATDIV